MPIFTMIGRALVGCAAARPRKVFRQTLALLAIITWGTVFIHATVASTCLIRRTHEAPRAGSRSGGHHTRTHRAAGRRPAHHVVYARRVATDRARRGVFHRASRQCAVVDLARVGPRAVDRDAPFDAPPIDTECSRRVVVAVTDRRLAEHVVCEGVALKCRATTVIGARVAVIAMGIASPTTITAGATETVLTMLGETFVGRSTGRSVDLLTGTQAGNTEIAHHTIRVIHARRFALHVIFTHETTGAWSDVTPHIAQPLSATDQGLGQEIPIAMDRFAHCSRVHEQVIVIAVAPLAGRPAVGSDTETLGLIGYPIAIGVLIQVQNDASDRAHIVDHIVAVVIHVVAGLHLPGMHIVVGVLAIARFFGQIRSLGTTQTF